MGKSAKRGPVAWLKKTFNAKPWNNVRTRKKTLVFAVLFAVIYTIINLIMTLFNAPPDGTLTSEVFSFCKWLVGTGTSITLADKACDTIYGMRNQDSEEEIIDE